LSSYFQPVPDEITPGWEFSPVWVDGKLRGFQLTNPRFGTLNYGRSPAGPYDTWWFEEVGGGGSVILPYAINPETGKTYIGLLSQSRPLQDEHFSVLGVPRGYKPPEATHEEAAQQEYREETGDKSVIRPVFLDGAGGNPNNASFDTREGGIQFYTVEVPWDALVHASGEEERYVFRDNTLTTEQKLEGIQTVAFIEDDLQKISRLGDMMTLACYVRWLAWRQRQS